MACAVGPIASVSAAQAINAAARGIIAATPVELPVMQAAAVPMPGGAAAGGTELPVVQAGSR